MSEDSGDDSQDTFIAAEMLRASCGQIADVCSSLVVMSAHQLIQAQLNNQSLDFLGSLDREEADSEQEAMILQSQSKPISALHPVEQLGQNFFVFVSFTQGIHISSIQVYYTKQDFGASKGFFSKFLSTLVT